MKKLVLIVDDNPSDLIIAESVLAGADLEIVTAGDGYAAINILDEEPFDLLIVDLQMPQMGGIDLIKRVRNIQKCKNIPILVVSARGEIRDVQLAVKVGANDYIVKPIDHAIFEDKVNKLVGESTDKAWIQYPVRGVLPNSVGVATKKFELVSLNELGMVIETREIWSLGELAEFSGDFFKSRSIDPIQGQVAEITHQADVYQIHIVFVATTDVFRKQVRLLCRELWRLNSNLGKKESA